MQSVEKTCQRCKVSKPIELFPNTKRHQYACKRCIADAEIARRKSLGSTPIAERLAADFAPSKACYECGATYPSDVSYWGKMPGSPHRLNTRCKSCVKKRASTDAAKLVVNATNRNSPTVRARRAEAMRRWRERNPEQAKANNRLVMAIKRGHIERGPCVRCGSTKDVHGHHHSGYDRANWFNVEWLCRPCHVAEHHATPG